MTISRITIEFVFCIVVDKWDIMQVFDFHTFCAVKHTGLSIKLEKIKAHYSVKCNYKISLQKKKNKKQKGGYDFLGQMTINEG